jgi:hypothetical protein
MSSPVLAKNMMGAEFESRKTVVGHDERQDPTLFSAR